MFNKRNIIIFVSIVTLIAVIVGIFIYSKNARQITEPAITEAIFDFPPVNAIDEQITALQELITGQMEIVDTLDITGCKPNPKVLGLSSGLDLLLKNDDAQEHTIYFTDYYGYSVPAQGTLAIKASEYIPGIHRYTCDSREKYVGIVVAY